MDLLASPACEPGTLATLGAAMVRTLDQMELEQGVSAGLGVTVDPDGDAVVLVVIGTELHQVAVPMTPDVAIAFGRAMRDMAREAQGLQDELDDLEPGRGPGPADRDPETVRRSDQLMCHSGRGGGNRVLRLDGAGFPPPCYRPEVPRLNALTFDDVAFFGAALRGAGTSSLLTPCGCALSEHAPARRAGRRSGPVSGSSSPAVAPEPLAGG